MTYYKAFRSDGLTLHCRPAWPLPHGKRPGKWVEVKGDLAPCENGLHIMRECDLPHWPGWHLYEVEVNGEVVEADDKVVARKARLTRKVEAWTDRTLYAWLADCAERVLPIFEKRYSKDDRPRKAVEAVRAFLRGETTKRQLRDAAYAAYAAANAAANADANAAYAAYAAYAAANAAAYAAYAAANAAAYAAANAAAYAAYAAARSSERKWQAARMLAYINGEVQP